MFLSAAFLACAVAFAARLSAQTNPPPRLAVNNAGQFTVHAPDSIRSSLLCVVASQIKREWLRRFDIPDKWRDPIVLVYTERPADTAAARNIWLETIRTPLHLQYHVQLRAPLPLERDRLVAAVVESLCAEYANRNRDLPRNAPAPLSVIPPWLIEGLAQSMDANPDQLLPVLRRCVNSGRPLTADELLTATTVPADAADRLRFQAHAWAFVENLLSLPKGADKLCQLLANNTASPRRDFTENYRWQFPTDAALEKWWALLLADRATAMIAEDRAAAETARQLNTILDCKLEMRLPDAVAEAPVAFTDLGRYTEKDWLAPLVRQKLAELVSLRGIAHPFYRNTIAHYIAALESLLAGQLGRYQHETTLARRDHATADQQTKDFNAYLDNIERERTPPDRAALWRQMKLFDTTHELQILRRDPLTEYIDRFSR